MSRVLVTGGTGFIGRAIVEKCLRDGDTVRILDNNSRGAIQKLAHLSGKVDFIEGDIRDLKVVNRATKDIDRVIHLAYINGTEYFYSRPYDVLDVGIRGILNVLDSHKVNQFSELIVASTSETYQNAAIIPTPEEVPLVIPDVLNPRYSYGGGKIATELLSINYARQVDLSVKIFRPHNIYGPDMGFEHVIPQLIKKIHNAHTLNSKKCSIEIQGNGSETRSFCYISDFINGFEKVVEDNTDLSVYHLGVTEEVSILQLIDKIAKIMEVNVEVNAGELLKGSPVRRSPDISKIRRLGFMQEFSLEKGLEPTIQWYLANQK
jgi:nucleoside-diphosphate-sugar epimerase